MNDSSDGSRAEGMKFVLVTEGSYSDYMVRGLLEVPTTTPLKGADAAYQKAMQEWEAADIELYTQLAVRERLGILPREKAKRYGEWREAHPMPDPLQMITAALGGRILSFEEFHIGS